MKNLKMRIWNEKENKFIYSDEFDKLNFTEINEAIENGTLTTNTGLKDVNGNEIYEGDFVTVYNTYKEENLRGVIIYKPDNAEFVLRSPELTSHKRWINYKMKIVGNKFETPGYLVKFELEQDSNK